MNLITKKIRLVASAKTDEAAFFFQFLTTSFPGVFEVSNETSGSPAAGTIFFGEAGSESTAPGLVVVPSNKQVDNARVQFGSSAEVPAIFRKREVMQKQVTVLDRPLDGEEVLASADGQPIWTVRSTGAFPRFRCALSLPDFKKDLLLFQHLSSDVFVRFLPIIDFIKRAGVEEGWTPPPLRGQIMFDDPNLHGLSYGWLDYPKLVASAGRHNYHASFATIPLDAWFTSAKSAAFFREHSQRLSLLVHGNNHVSNELASFPSESAAIASMGQAYNRIRELEKKSGVEVSKVVAAPHGACSEQTLGVLARLGYESACISHGSLFGHNRGKNWTRNIGVAIAEVVQGTPVMPRFRLCREAINRILLSVYFDQPIIPVGHHQDVRDKMAMLETVAEFINSLGTVNWLDLKSISRANYYTKQKRDELSIRTFARVFEIEVPADVTKISIERPWLGHGWKEGLKIIASGREIHSLADYAGETLTVSPSTKIEVVSIHPNAIDCSSQPGGLNLKAFARRQLCEVRDRVVPMLSRS